MTVEQLEKKIEEVENRLAGADQALADPEVWRDGKKMDRLSAERQKLVEKLEPLEFEWSRRAEGE